jgi:hypothetical protein
LPHKGARTALWTVGQWSAYIGTRCAAIARGWFLGRDALRTLGLGGLGRHMEDQLGAAHADRLPGRQQHPPVDAVALYMSAVGRSQVL